MILVIGSTIIIFGALLLILPGPGILVIMFGLSVLAAEFYWAKRWLEKIKNSISSVTTKIKKTSQVK